MNYYFASESIENLYCEFESLDNIFDYYKSLSESRFKESYSELISWMKGFHNQLNDEFCKLLSMNKNTPFIDKQETQLLSLRKKFWYLVGEFAVRNDKSIKEVAKNELLVKDSEWSEVY